MPWSAFRRDRARNDRAGEILRVGGAVLVALALVTLSPAAEAKRDKSYGGDRSYTGDRSYMGDRSARPDRSYDIGNRLTRPDRSYERVSSGVGDRSTGRPNGRGQSDERRGWGDRGRSNDRGRGSSNAQDRNDRGGSNGRARQSWGDRGDNGGDNARDDDRGNAGGSSRSIGRAVEANDNQGSSTIQQSNETPAGGQSVDSTPPAASPDSTAAPQTQAPTDNSPAADSDPGRRAAGGGDRAGRQDGDRASRQDGDGSRRAGSEAGRAGDRSGGGAFAGPALAPLDLLPSTTGVAPPAAADGDAASRQDRGRDDAAYGPASPVVRTVRDIVETVPAWMKWAIAGLAALSLLLAAGYALSALRARRLARQRAELLGEVGLLQAALLPPVPDELTEIGATVAYAPADGPGAGGDFYDVLPLAGGRTGFVLGDLSGHGREAIERTAFMRYTLRAYLEAGLEPAAALQVAGRVIGDDLDGDFATVLLAVHDPRDSSLTFASAGHPPPIVVGGRDPFEPVLAGGSPPLGIGERTGMRQTTVPLASRSVACLYTDGLSEARTADGLLGDKRLELILAGLGPDATARQLLDAVAAEAVATPDDMATCLLSPKPNVSTGSFRRERLELSTDELDGPLLERFLMQCDVPDEQRAQASAEAREVARGSGGAVVTVVFGSRRSVEVLPHNVVRLDSASRRAA